MAMSILTAAAWIVGVCVAAWLVVSAKVFYDFHRELDQKEKQ